MRHLRRLRKLAPLVSLILIIVLALYAPWQHIGRIFSRLSLLTIIGLICLSGVYYALKTIRFWYLLRAMEIKQPFWPVAISYLSAQPASLLPGGEVFRSHALEEHTGVPVKKSLAQFTLQGILEGAGLATVMILSAVALHALRVPAVILLGLVLAALVGLARGYMRPFLHALNHLPFIHVSEASITHFNHRHELILNRRQFPNLYLLSLLIECVGTAIAYVSVSGLHGQINIFQAGLLYTIPIIVGFISLLPGGIGLSEQSAVGVLLLSKVTVAQAVASTLLMRVTIVGLGLIYGGIALLFGQYRLR